MELWQEPTVYGLEVQTPQDMSISLAWTTTSSGTVGALAQSNYGKVIIIFHEGAHVGRNQTILSAIQMEHFYNKVADDRAIGPAGGLATADGHNFAISIVNGLPYVQMKPYTG